MTPTTRTGGPRNFKEFQEFTDGLIPVASMMFFGSLFFDILGAVIGTVLWLLGSVAGQASYAEFTPMHIIAMGSAWSIIVVCLIIPSVTMISYAQGCIKRGHLSLICLPWRQPWSWLIVAYTFVPWGPCWLISLFRYLLTRHKRPYETKKLQPQLSWSIGANRAINETFLAWSHGFS